MNGRRPKTSAGWLGATLAALLIVAGARGARPAERRPGTPRPVGSSTLRLLSETGVIIDGLLDRWQFAAAAQAITELRTRAPDAPETLYLEGYELFIRGDYQAAVAKLRAIPQRGEQHGVVTGLLALAEAAQLVIAKHNEQRSSHFVLRYPPEDEVLAELALDTLEAALAYLTQDLGFVPAFPIAVDIYRSAEDLATVSPLTVAEVERTGTVALCKWGRLMATSPRALRFGYPWLDTLAHELVHHAVSSLTQDRAPVWLQEGLAKFLESRWRGTESPTLPPSLEHLLARGLKKGQLIPFDAMHPSMAKLPSAEDAALAFAEVATVVELLHKRGGAPLLREVLARVADGADARDAVAATLGTSWKVFEDEWRSQLRAQRYRTFPDFEPIAPTLRRRGAANGRSGPSEDESPLLPDAATQMLRLGNMLLLQGRPRAAAIQYEKGLQKARPGDWLFPVKLGRTYLALRDPERALAVVARFRTLYPELPWPHLIAGKALLQRGDLDLAVHAFEAALGNNPFDPEIHCGLSEALSLQPALDDRRAARRAHARRFCTALGGNR